MAWEISHAPEAFDNARTNLTAWSREKLIEAISDNAFEVSEQGDSPIMPFTHAEQVKHNMESKSQEELVEHCMELIRENGTCDNGGYNFYIDREGYHMVSVSVVKV